MGFTPLGDALHDRMRVQTPLKRQIEASQVVEVATAVFVSFFGDAGKNAKPLFLKNRTLTVTCTTSAIAQEIRLRQAELVASMNEKLGKNEVDRIRYLA